jgi:hypothetical protein
MTWKLYPERKQSSPGSDQPSPTLENLRADRQSVAPQRSNSVALNRSPEVLDGFRGNVHPVLHGSTRLEVEAHWTPVGTGRDRLHRTVNPVVYAWFTELRPDRPRRTYTEEVFSAFLPTAVGQVGQIWALDADKVAGVLRQFHPRPSMRLVAPGRRAGPDGAFAILRAVAPPYLDIVFRIHAEFYVTPDDLGPWSAVGAWYTPAYFSGRVLVNEQTGTVDHFRLELPTDKTLNVHLTVDANRLGYKGNAHDIVRVERMELTGGDEGLVTNIRWAKELTPDEARRRLAKVFYQSLEAEWVPFDQVLEQARSRNRPIFAVVSWGAIDDQSC